MGPDSGMSEKSNDARTPVACVLILSLRHLNSRLSSVRSFLCQSRPRLTRLRSQRFKVPAPFMSLMFGLVIIVQAFTLPLPVAFLFVDAGAPAMTKGCKKKTCCTALCYLDKNGVHHCVHVHDDSCDSGLSMHDMTENLILYPTAGTLPKIEPLLPDLIPDTWISLIPASAKNHLPATPSPPPK